MKTAVFLERDGVLNLAKICAHRQRQQSPMSLDEFRVNPAVRTPLRELKEAGFLLIATTNQPAISRGILSRRELDLMHNLLTTCLPLNDILICPHDELDDCPCRKPATGLFTEAAFKWHIDLDHSFIVSDKWQDAEAARQLGCTSLLIDSPWIGAGHHDFILKNLESVSEKILEAQSQPLLLMDQP